MASFLSSTLFLALISAAAAGNGLIFPIRKDPETSQHMAALEMGSNRDAIDAVVDLGSPFLWFSCTHYTTKTYARIPCYTAECNATKGIGCTDNACGAVPVNPFLPYIVAARYAADAFHTINGALLPAYPFACVDDGYLTGLAAGANGMLGLARSLVSLHYQASTKLKLIDTFSLCLPSSGAGKLTVGVRSQIAKSFKSTPLIANPVSTYPIYNSGDASEEYFIGVKAIHVAGVKLNLKDSYFSFDKNGVGGTKLSTLQNLTVVHSSIYKPLARAFVKAASDLGIRSAAAVAPFRACFSSGSIARAAAVPEIDLILAGKSGNVTWRMRGANLMVEVDRKTTCLGIVDGGSNPRTAVVIGAHQLEENFLEFDLVSSQLRFSESLLFMNTSCSKI